MTKIQRENEIRRLQRRAQRAELNTNDLYEAMGQYSIGGYELWGDDDQERFGDLETVAAQVRMIYDEVEMRYRGYVTFPLRITGEVIQEAIWLRDGYEPTNYFDATGKVTKRL